MGYYLTFAFDKECKNSIILMEGTLEEIDKFTSQFKSSVDVRKKFKKEIDQFCIEKSEYIKKVEEKTKNNTGLVLNIAFNYGGRDEITTATKKIAEKVKNGELNIEDITEELISNNLYTAGQPDPDLLIRTSGEERISNFLTWQISYSEFVFTDKYWPAFSNQDLLETIAIYQKRTRRFGGNK